MKRRILFINLALLGVTVLLGYEIRQDRPPQMREKQILSGQAGDARRCASPADSRRRPSLRAASYADLAMRTLFAKDRNPNVIVEPPPPPPPPPPVPLPLCLRRDGPGRWADDRHGAAGGKQRFYQKGAQGRVLLVDIRPDHEVLEWNEKTFEKKLSDLADRTGGTQEANTPPPATNAPPIAAQAPTPPPITKGEAAPSAIDIGGGIRGCNQGDTSPNGTVVGGLRKIVTSTLLRHQLPLGTSKISRNKKVSLCFKGFVDIVRGRPESGGDGDQEAGGESSGGG